MPSKLVLPSASVLSSSPPRSCLPRVLTGCMITAALRTGLPLSSFTTMKFRTAVGSSFLSRCARASPRSTRVESNAAIVHVVMRAIFIWGHSSDNKWRRKERSDGWRELKLFGGIALVLGSNRRGKLHQIAGDAGGVVAGYAGIIEIVSLNGDHTESFDNIEIGNDLACTLERVFSLEVIGNRRGIAQGMVKDLLPGVAVKSADMVGGGKAQAFVGLGH